MEGGQNMHLPLFLYLQDEWGEVFIYPFNDSLNYKHGLASPRLNKHFAAIILLAYIFICTYGVGDVL